MSEILECTLCHKRTTDMMAVDRILNPFNCGFCGGFLREPAKLMSTELKHKLYDAFLKDTPIKFESVTEEQFVALKDTVIGAGIMLRQAYADFCLSIIKQTKELFNGR